MIKYVFLLILFMSILTSKGFGQLGNDGSFFWNSTGISYLLNDKTEFVLSNKDHFNIQIGRFDYLHFDLAGYRKLSDHFSLGLGLRLNETYKSEIWNPGGAYMFYGVYSGKPGNVKIRFANRVAIRTFKVFETQYTFDNITNVDFFVRSASKLPKPYIMDEIFSNIYSLKVQTIRLYGGFHILNLDNLGIDLYYCYHLTRPTMEWKEYNVFGINTKFRI
ncbi:MAG TPA: hypothetical protein DCR40_04955 [Prolixibacteraceae bacterium]|nr:hypothetical protein [Prolixibacteraceae bacterium]